MSTSYTKRLLGKEDVDFDSAGTGATSTYGSLTVHKFNASHVPLTADTRWGTPSVTTVDAALSDLNDRVEELSSLPYLDADKTVTLTEYSGMQSKINDEPKNLGGNTITFALSSGVTYPLGNGIYFKGFYNGSLVLSGSSATFSDNNAALTSGYVVQFEDCACGVQMTDLNVLNRATSVGASVLGCSRVDIVGGTFSDGLSESSSHTNTGIKFESSLGNLSSVTFSYEGVDVSQGGVVGDKFDDIDDSLEEHGESIETLETDVEGLQAQMDGNVTGNYPILWGRNSSGEMGCGTDSMFGPTLIGMPLHMICAHFSNANGVAIFNGMLYVCGTASYGSLCQFKDSTSGWTCVSEMGDWTSCGIGAYHGAAIRAKALYTWGSNSKGQLGNGKSGVNNYQPCHVLSRKASTSSTSASVITSDDWSAIAVGPQFVLALTSDGVLYASGSNSSGQSGLAASITKTIYFTKCFEGVASKISAGGFLSNDVWYGFSFLISSAGKLYSTGNNGSGQLGLGDTTTRYAFTLVTSRLDSSGTEESHTGDLADWAAVSCGNKHTAAITRDGKLYICGSANGCASSSSVKTFKNVPMPTGETAKDVVCGYDLTLVLMESGKVYGYGYNSSYSLGDKKSAKWDTLTSICRNGTTATAVNAKAIFSGPNCHGGCFITDTRLVLDGSTVQYLVIAVSGHATSDVNGNYTLSDETATGNDRVWKKGNYKVYYDTTNSRWSLYNTNGSSELSHVEVDVSEPVNGSWTNNVTMAIGDEEA